MGFGLNGIFILTLFQGVLRATLIRESGGGMGHPGGSLRLSCEASGFSIANYSLCWVRLSPESRLDCLGCVNPIHVSPNSTTPLEGHYAVSSNVAAQGRFGLSMDTARHVLHLRISSLETQDAGIYYCARLSKDSPGLLDLWGPGTLVTVSSAKSTAPSVFPLVSCCDPSSEGESVLGCLVSGYFPEPVTMSWNSEVLDGIITFPAAHDSTSGLYTTTSLLTISDSNSQEYTCSVDHLPTKTKIKKSVSLQVCPPGTIIPPMIKLFHSSCDPRGDAHSTIQLLCLVSGFSPAKAQVTWLVDGQEAENLFPYTTRPKREGGNTFSLQSELNITQGQWMSSKTYTCHVKHNGSSYEGSAQRCSDTDPRGISIFLSPPSVYDLYISKAPVLTCLIVDLASGEDAKVSWTRESGGPISPSSPVVKKQYNGTVTVTSTLPVQTNDWVEGDTYTCHLEHPDLPFPLISTIAKAPGKRIAPQVYVFPPHAEEKGNTVSLTCFVRGFFPSDIFVQWLHDNKEDHTGHHTTTRPHKDHGSDPSFFLYSRMIVNKSNWEEGHTFTCRVVHEAIPLTHTIEKSLHYSAGN